MEKLYNNILLPDDFHASPSDASHVPYLENPPEIIDITIGRQLFVDDFLIAETDLTTKYHKPVKYEGNPVLQPETPWERTKEPVTCPKSGGVWYDEKEKIWKMWYEAGWCTHLAYATSRDGIHWDRPDLGEVPGTNLILPYDGYDPEKICASLDYPRPDSTTVWIDDDGPAEERYKLFLRTPGWDFPAMVGISDDGIHFRDFQFTSPMGDRSTMFYNPFRKKWVYSLREYWSGRSRMYRECDHLLDGATWQAGESHQWMAADPLDLPDPYIGFTPQLYNLDAVGYESIMLGMFQILYGPDIAAGENDYGAPKITELQPMYSRDGYHFSRPNRDTFIDASRIKGTWDRGYVQSVGGVCVIHGDELWIYYVGFAGDERYTSLQYDPNKKYNISGTYHNGATGLAKLRRDGFVSRKGDGRLTTRLLTCTGKVSLHVNVIGSVQAEILAADGTILAVSKPFCGDSTNHKLDFRGFTMDRLEGIPFRIRFAVHGKLFSFGMANEKGDFGGAHGAGMVH